MVNQPPINLGGTQGARSLYQFTLQDTDTERAVRMGAQVRSDHARPAGNRRTSAAICRSRIRRCRSRSTATRSARSDSRSIRWKRRCTTRTARGRSRRSTRRTISIRSCCRSRRNFRRDPSALGLLYVRSINGPSHSARHGRARLGPTRAPSAVSHTGQLPSVTISFNLEQGVALGDAVTAIQTAATATCPRRSPRAFREQRKHFRIRSRDSV